MEKLITVTEAALQLGVTKRTLQDWDRKKEVG
jgi:excisionase family DNA binding protein